jgi:hypothetical protein
VGALTAASGFLVFHAQEARLFSLAMALTAVSHALLLRGLAAKSPRWIWVGYAVVTALGAYTFYYFLFVPLAHLAHATTRFSRVRKEATDGDASRRDLVEAAKRGLVGLLGAQAAAAVLFLPWAVTVIPRRVAELEAYGVARAAGLGALGKALVELVLGGPLPLAAGGSADGSVIGALGLVLAVATWGAFLAARARNPEATRFCLLAVFVPVVAVLLIPLRGHPFETRHLSIVCPSGFLIFGACFGAVPDMRSRSRWLAILVALAPAVVLAVNLTTLARYRSAGFEKQDWRSLVRDAAASMRAGDTVVFNPFYLEAPFNAYHTGLPSSARTTFERRYTYDSRVSRLPLVGPIAEALWLGEADVRAGTAPRTWLVEVLDSSVAPREPRMPAWLNAAFERHATKTYPGYYGVLSLTLYDSRRR